MTGDESEDISKASTRTSTSYGEETPLLPNPPRKPKKWGKSVTYLVLLTSFLVSLSFGVTQVPLIYVFGVMTCDEYYKTHPIPSFGDRCHHHEIEASTARAVALLGSSTTLFGVINLFVTGWTIKRFGVKTALLVSIFWPAVRLLVQNVGVMTGAGLGIVIVQCSQIITVVGGPAGYLLALNSFATEIVKPSERTAMLGRLQGCAMFGTSIGFLSGGLLSDKFGILAPFRVAFVLFLLSTLYGMFCLPTVGYNKDIEAKASKSLSAFFAPLKMFAPQKYFLKDGKGITTEYGVLLLGSGVFLGVLATGYQSTLLQLYSTDIFDFGTSANGWLIFLNTSIRGAFLTLAFPIIIKKGRRMLARREHNVEHLKPPKVSEIPSLPVTPTEFAPAPSMEPEQEPVEPPKAADHKEGFGFDLMYTKYSILADGLLTFPATFTNQGWQMYLVAAILPLAAGTASASKGTILQMCNDANASDEEMAGKRADALSAISLVEMLARLSTTSLFGLIFSAFADIGKPHLVFAVNAAVALLAFLVLAFARFPPEGSTRYSDDNGEDESHDDR